MVGTRSLYCNQRHASQSPRGTFPDSYSAPSPAEPSYQTVSQLPVHSRVPRDSVWRRWALPPPHPHPQPVSAMWPASPAGHTASLSSAGGFQDPTGCPLLLAPACPSSSRADVTRSAVLRQGPLWRAPAGSLWIHWAEGTIPPLGGQLRTASHLDRICPQTLVPERQRGGFFSLRLTWHLGVIADFCKRSKRERNEVAVRKMGFPLFLPTSPLKMGDLSREEMLPRPLERE